MHHLDLFSGIGGASLAADRIWGKENIQHTFCEIDEYCRQVLKKHWPQATIFADIRTLTADSYWLRCVHGKSKEFSTESNEQTQRQSIPSTHSSSVFLLTGGFPCQPFSQAGRRKGTDDNRYLWPEMLRVIREFQPRWVVAENVAGLLTIQQGMVFGQVLTDLEGENYEVQPFVIPAVAVNAPHRRDRIWIVAHDRSAGLEEARTELEPTRDRRGGPTDTNSGNQGCGARDEQCGEDEGKNRQRRTGMARSVAELSGGQNGWDKNWLKVATELCGMDDGLPAELDGLKLSKSAHRRERLKALGNAWVPQVAEEIFKAIKEING